VILGGYTAHHPRTFQDVLRDLPNLDPHEQARYDDLRNDRLGDRVRLEQERVKYQLVEEVVLALHH
jgi:hypothetical protein